MSGLLGAWRQRGEAVERRSCCFRLDARQLRYRAGNALFPQSLPGEFSPMRETARLWLLAALWVVAPVAAAEEVILRDGRKLTGTIRGVEGGVYRLETDFGVALIRKEWISHIDFSPGVGKEASGGKPPAQKAAARLLVRRARAPSPAPPPLIRERRVPGGRVQEHTKGTTYINETYRFQLFKPPTWRVLEHAARSIPSAVAVLGTPDESTLLVVGSVLYDGPPSAYGKILEASLRQNYSEYVAKPEDQIRVAGRPATRRRFQGMAGGYEWHGLVVNLADGSAHYGIIGVTRHEYFQFKESVLSKVVKSFRFR